MGALIPLSGGNVSVYEAPDNPWAEAASSVETGAYLKFNGNTGEYTYGADDNPLGYGAQLVGDLFNVAFGWICWKDSEPVEETMVKIMDGKPPLEHQLPDHGPFDSNDDGWREATALPMVLLVNVVDGVDSEEEAGTKLMFKGSSGSSVRGIRKLSGAFGKLFREHQGEFPVIEISAEAFQAKEKKFGKKYAPMFKIVGWIGESELAGMIGDSTEGDYEQEDAPALPAPAPEVEPEEEAPIAPVSSRRGAAAAEPAAEPAQAPRSRRTPAPVAGADDELPAPEARGRSEGRRGAAPAAAPAAAAAEPAAGGGKRVRRF